MDEWGGKVPALLRRRAEGPSRVQPIGTGQIAEHRESGDPSETSREQGWIVAGRNPSADGSSASRPHRCFRRSEAISRADKPPLLHVLGRPLVTDDAALDFLVAGLLGRG